MKQIKIIGWFFWAVIAIAALVAGAWIGRLGGGEYSWLLETVMITMAAIAFALVSTRRKDP